MVDKTYTHSKSGLHHPRREAQHIGRLLVA
jgi:hypothetical protein